jgi:uncharacterized membrane protein
MSTSAQQDTASRSQRVGDTASGREATWRGRQEGSRVPQRYRSQGRFRPQGFLEDPERVAKGLGWFSIGLGLAQITAPRSLARLIGVNDRKARTRDTMFALGMREIASGIGILTRPRPTGWVWTRVGGDVMDLAALGKAFNSPRNNRNRVAAATAAVVGVTLLDFLIGQELGRESGTMGGRREGGVHVAESITINRSADEIYRFWRNSENLPRFMSNVDSVQTVDDRRQHWRMRMPTGTQLEWDAEIVDDQPGQLIAWRSLPGADLPNSGAVRFVPAPGDRGTEVHVELSSELPGGRVAGRMGKLLAREQVANNLRRLKQLLEAGEIIKSDSSIYRGPHPAQPPAEPVASASNYEGGM